MFKGGVRKIAPNENCPLRLELEFGLGLALELGSGGNFPRRNFSRTLKVVKVTN